MLSFFIVLIFHALGCGNRANAKPKDNDIPQFAGNFYFAPQTWPNVGNGSDTKFGLGLGGMFGLKMPLGDTTTSIGPHIGISHWSADYSKKSGGATDSVFVEMVDLGMEFQIEYENVQMIIGAGGTQLSSGMIIGGKTQMYPGLDKAQYQYTAAGLGFKMENYYIAVVAVSYSGYAHYADRMEIRGGMTL
ncbi:MAG: hypothetical protein WC624_01470 [Candidatus Margulisiibacteriota bacterium]